MLSIIFSNAMRVIVFTSGRRQSKTLMPSTNVDKISLETKFLIAICRPTGDKWQSKTLFLAIFDPRSAIVNGVFDFHQPDVLLLVCLPVLNIILYD